MRRIFNRGISSLLAVLAAASLMGGCESSGDSFSADEILIDEVDDEAEEIFADDIEEIFGNDIEEIFGDDEVTEIIPEKGEIFENYSPDIRNEGTTLRILTRTDEFETAFKTIFGEENIPEGIDLEIIVYNSPDYEYRLDELLSSYADDPVDIFITEAHYSRPYADSELTLPLSEAGITSVDTEMMYPYTIGLGTSSDGVLKALSYSAWTGVFAYRRDIALEVFGNDDPDYVHSLISDDFEGTAAALAEKGYYIIPSVWETFKPYSQRRISPWLDESGNITIDPMLKSWAEDMKEFSEKNYIPDYQLWSDEWCRELTSDGKTFGTFLSSWGAEFTIPIYDQAENSGGNGNWGMCVPPYPYFWGGYYMNISANTDNLDLCGEIIKKMVLNEDALAQYAAESRDFCNNRSAMQKVIDSGEGYSEFYAQNNFEIYAKSAEGVKAEAEYSSEYDSELELVFQGNMLDYIYGPYTYEDAEGLFFAYTELAEIGAR